MNAREKARSERRFARARALFAKLDATERTAIFREFSVCACREVVKLASRSPGTAIGAIVGGLLGAAFEAVVDSEAPRLGSQPHDPYGLLGPKRGV